MADFITIKELENRYPNEWLLVEILGEDDKEQPSEVRLIAHSKARDDIYEQLKNIGGAIKDIGVFFAGEIPKKGYAVAF